MNSNISGDSLTKMRMYVNVSYGIHSYCKDYTGMTMTFGAGTAMIMSKGYKINVKIVTESELSGIDDTPLDILRDT